MRKKRLLTVAVVLALALAAVAIIGLFPPDLEARVGICEEALGRCGVDAVIAGLMGGAPAFGAYGAACALGYMWCLEYL